MKKHPRPGNARLWRSRWPQRAVRAADRRFGRALGVDSHHAAAPVDLVALEETLAVRAGPEPKTVATDPLGRLRIDLIEGPTGQG